MADPWDSPGALATLIVLADHADEAGLAHPSTTTIATRLGTNRNAVRGYLAILEQRGLIAIDQGGRQGAPRWNQYHLRFEPARPTRNKSEQVVDLSPATNRSTLDGPTRNETEQVASPATNRGGSNARPARSDASTCTISAPDLPDFDAGTVRTTVQENREYGADAPAAPRSMVENHGARGRSERGAHASDPRVRRVIAHYLERFRTTHGVTPSIAQDRDYQLVADLLAQHDEATICSCIDRFLAETDDFVRRRGFSLPLLRSQFNAYLLERTKLQTAQDPAHQVAKQRYGGMRFGR